MTYEISSPTTTAEHSEQRNRNATTSAGPDYRRRQLDIFRQREHELETEGGR
ncbi:hypothetical protein [Cryobacterium sp. M91]|uniref:hypothetical protein n=1 Tax=Cryobacterium sp. M91 TaxID=2048294 RepID=UPI0013047D58|nr:hypothetical protein [Cryobacterium sp. M91]